MGKDIYFVIGGSGFLGRHIVEALKARGDSVSVFDIVQRYHDVPFYSGDMCDQVQLEDALRKSDATCIIHTASPLAGGNDPKMYWKVNYDGTKTVIAAAVALGIPKLVYTSSAGVVFDGSDLKDVDERLPFPAKPMDAYNASKAKAEEAVLAANGQGGLSTVALRPAGIFGEGDRQAIPGFAKVYQEGKTHFQIGDNTNLFDWTYVGNVAKAHLLAADKLSPSEKPIPLEELSSRPLPSIDLSVETRPIPTSNARPVGPAVDLPSEADKLEAAFKEGRGREDYPVMRTRFDQFSEASLKETPGIDQVAGQAFFITNGEPLYFWDFPRAIWHGLGDSPDRRRFVMPRFFGLILGTLSEWGCWLVGKEPTLTRYKIIYTCANRYHNIEKARRLLGYEPDVGIAEGIERSLKWYKAEVLKTA